MATEDLQRIKSFLPDYLETITTKGRGKLYNCPICGSGTGPHRTGALGVFADGQKWKCQSCNAGGDIFDLYAAVNHCTGAEAAKALLAMYGGSFSECYKKGAGGKKAGEPTGEPAQKERENDAEIAQDIKAFHAAIERPGNAGEMYFFKRNLTKRTIDRFNLGYDESTHEVIIPYSETYYQRRSIEGKTFRNLTGVRMPLFNAVAMRGDVCFVVESPICAMSIEQAGGNAVALGGTGGANRLYDALREGTYTGALVLCMDNDEPGKKAAEDIASVLARAGVRAYIANIAGTHKDPNDLLQAEGASALEAAVSEAIKAASEPPEGPKNEPEEAGAGMVDRFLEVVQSRKYEPMPTGITDIDKAIGGGLIRQQLVLLGAAPGVGKTALAQWIFEGMATRGVSCVYLNLEMSREQMLARSLARITAASGRKLRATDILQGYRWTDAERAAILEAANQYKATIAPRMIYNPDTMTADLDALLSYIEQAARNAESAGRAAPCVVLDYLQILRSTLREDDTMLLKRAVGALKGFAIAHNTVVFAIMAHNRTSNATGQIGLESGRDTSALEYSADLQLGLTFTKCLDRGTEKGKAVSDLTQEERKHITLKVTKGRFGGAGQEVDLLFDGETMTYSQLAPDWLAECDRATRRR